jgi:hypothetical protein
MQVPSRVPGGGATRGNDIGSLIVVWMSVPARLEDQPLGVVLAGLLTLSSITAGIGRTPALTASGTLNCRDPIGTEDRLPANSKVAGRAVALLTGLPGRRALGAARVSEALLPSHRFWSKTPLYVRTRKAAEIRVPRRERGRIAMTWGNTASDPLVDRTFLVGPYVTRPGCSTLLVRVDSTDAPVRIGIGAPCTGK